MKIIDSMEIFIIRMILVDRPYSYENICGKDRWTLSGNWSKLKPNHPTRKAMDGKQK
ncbi:MAG: hypothetical protein WC227_03830 [Patescibacteria group bacterium]